MHAAAAQTNKSTDSTDAGKPVNWPNNNHWQAAWNINGWDTSRFAFHLVLSVSPPICVQYKFHIKVSLNIGFDSNNFLHSVIWTTKSAYKFCATATVAFANSRSAEVAYSEENTIGVSYLVHLFTCNNSAFSTAAAAAVSTVSSFNSYMYSGACWQFFFIS